MHSSRLLPLACLLLVTWLTGCTAPSESTTSGLRSALLLHASFDGKLDADFAVGDATLYTAPTGDRTKAVPGLPASNLVVHALGQGRHGGALQFTKKMRPTVFFKGFTLNAPNRCAISRWMNRAVIGVPS